MNCTYDTQLNYPDKENTIVYSPREWNKYDNNTQFFQISNFVTITTHSQHFSIEH